MTFMNQMKLVTEAMKSVPVNVKALARSLGVDVHEAYLDDRISGMLECRDGNYKITVNADHPDTRKRFTIAHELGHYILHRELVGNGVDDTVAYRSEDVGKYHNTNIGPGEETEANKFAASLLMPEKLVKEALRDGLSPGDMAKRFKVSAQSMDYRISGLRLMSG